MRPRCRRGARRGDGVRRLCRWSLRHPPLVARARRGGALLCGLRARLCGADGARCPGLGLRAVPRRFLCPGAQCHELRSVPQRSVERQCQRRDVMRGVHGVASLHRWRGGRRDELRGVSSRTLGAGANWRVDVRPLQRGALRQRELHRMLGVPGRRRE